MNTAKCLRADVLLREEKHEHDMDENFFIYFVFCTGDI